MMHYQHAMYPAFTGAPAQATQYAPPPRPPPSMGAEEARRTAARAADALQPFFIAAAEAAFPAAASGPSSPPERHGLAMAPTPTGGGVLERGLRRHLKAQGSPPPPAAAEPSLGSLCSAAFASESASYTLGRAA